MTTELMESVNKTTTSQETALRLACQCARIARDFRGHNTVVLDLRELTPIFDYFVISTGTSRRQMHAIAEEIDKLMKAEGSARQGIEGFRQSSWILQDYGDIVVHLLEPEARNHYALESLWADARRVDWEAELGLPKTEVTPAPQFEEEPELSEADAEDYSLDDDEELEEFLSEEE